MSGTIFPADIWNLYREYFAENFEYVEINAYDRTLYVYHRLGDRRLSLFTVIYGGEKTNDMPSKENVATWLDNAEAGQMCLTLPLSINAVASIMNVYDKRHPSEGASATSTQYFVVTGFMCSRPTGIPLRGHRGLIEEFFERVREFYTPRA